MKQRELTSISKEVGRLYKKVMQAKRVVSSQRPARVADAIELAERITERLRTL